MTKRPKRYVLPGDPVAIAAAAIQRMLWAHRFLFEVFVVPAKKPGDT